MKELFEFRNYGVRVGGNWTTQCSGARFGTDYLMRTAVGKSNIFVNTPDETTYFYHLDADGARLNGSRRYSVRFDAGQLPPVAGFWSITVYNKHHFFHANDLDRFSLGTKNQDLSYPAELANWLPAPDDDFSVYLSAYWPGERILNGDWAPPAVVPA